MLAMLVRYLWASPNTILGLMFVPTVCVPGGRLRVVDGVLEIHGPLTAAILRYCVPLRGGASAITLGHVVLGRDSASLADTRLHERVHVRQCEVWGPLFIPAYLAAGLWALVRGEGAYNGNHFEREARRCAGCIGLAVALCLCAPAALPQAAQEVDERIDRIVGMATTRGGAYAFLQHLTDSIGGRVTGSPESRAAADLLLSTLRGAGFEDAHFEEYAIESRWQHARAVGRVVSPVARQLVVGSYGWAPGTKGEVTATLVDLGASPNIDLAVDRVRGAAVIVEPQAMDGAPAQVMRARLASTLARSGAAAMLIPSDKPNRMLYTSAFGFYPAAPLPVLSVAREDVLFLRRLLANGTVRVTLDIANTIDASPAQERNVIAEIKGTSPGEMVLLGAHFDSWDPAQGAQDDGVGVAAILEAARILKSLGLKPRRTIRFAFFSGEEQALLGSRAYVERHRNELDGLRAVLIMDSGAETPRGFQIHGRADVEAAARTILAPLASLGASGVSLDASFDMDHGPFLAAGIPVLTLWVDAGDYDTHHHAVSDTFDKVDPRMLALDTAVMAVAAYRLAEAPEAPGRRLSATEAAQLLEKLGLESLRRAVYEPRDTR